MKAIYEHLGTEANQAILCRKIELPNFDAPFHYHPEYELTYIIKGTGLRYVGMKIEEFSAGDLVLLGPNLPHCWINKPPGDGECVAAFVIQFHSEILEKSILKLPEFYEIKQTLELSRQGLVINTNAQLKAQIERMFHENPAKQFLSLLHLLLDAGGERNRTVLEFAPSESVGQDRFQLIFSYLIEHFREQVDLEEMAEIAGLTPTSFCRYFKKVTGRTLFETILDYRVEAAAQLLSSSTKRINEVAFEAGFDDVPYFNRVFKKRKGLSPKQFRRFKTL